MALEFAKVDATYYEKLLADAYYRITGRTLLPADPERLFLNVVAYAMAILANQIQFSAEQNLLAYARGEYLDALAEFYGVKRLDPRPARTLLRFSIDAPLNFELVIPKGIRASTSDDKFVFATIKEAKIPAGETFVEVEAECLTPGTAANGLLIGQISKLVDPVPYVSKVENTSVSYGGADLEDDERLRERIRLSLERFSTAGPKMAYVYWVKTAHQDIEDVEVYSPAPGKVRILFLMKDGALPDDTMINYVEDFLDDDKKRPLTDQIEVVMPSVVSYDINLTYYINRKDATREAEIREKVSKAVDEFVRWTGTKLGRDILPEELIRLVKSAGAYRVDVASPERIELEVWQVGKAQNIELLYGGLVSD